MKEKIVQIKKIKINNCLIAQNDYNNNKNNKL